MSDCILYFSPQLSSLTKDAAQNVSPCQRNDGKEDSDLKEEGKRGVDILSATTEEKKAQEESKEETKQDAEVKEEKSGKNQNTEKKLDVMKSDVHERMRRDAVEKCCTPALM